MVDETFRKIHHDVYASMIGMWKHLFTMFVEAIDSGDLEKSRVYRQELEDVFVNTAENTRDLFLKLKEAEARIVELEQSTVAR